MMIWIISRQWIHIMKIISENPWLDLYHLSERQGNIVQFLYNGIVTSLTPSFTFAVIIWFLVTFRKEDSVILSINDQKLITS